MVKAKLKAVNALGQSVSPDNFGGGEVFCAVCGKKLLVRPGKYCTFFAHKPGDRCNYDADIKIKGFKDSWKNLFLPELCGVSLSIRLTNRDSDYVRQSLQPGFNAFKFAESWRGKKVETGGVYSIDVDVFIPVDYHHDSYDFNISGESIYPKKGVVLYFVSEPLSAQEFKLRNALLIGAGFNVCWIYSVLSDVKKGVFTRSRGHIHQSFDSYQGVYDVETSGNVCSWKDPSPMLEGFVPQKVNGALKISPLAFYFQTKDVNLAVPGDKWFLHNPVALFGRPNPWSQFTVDFRTPDVPTLLRKVGYDWNNLGAILKANYAQAYSAWAQQNFIQRREKQKGKLYYR